MPPKGGKKKVRGEGGGGAPAAGTDADLDAILNAAIADNVAALAAQRAAEETAAAAARALQGLLAATPAKETCWSCGADNPKCLCNACRVASYCNKTCQQPDFVKRHRSRCAKLAERAAVLARTCKSIKQLDTRGGRTSQTILDLTLYSACTLGRVGDVEALLAAGACLNKVLPETGAFPLFVAAREGHMRLVEFLVARGGTSGINRTANKGCTPVWAAAQQGRTRTVALLLDLGASVDSTNASGVSLLNVASLMGNEDTVALLLARGASVDHITDRSNPNPLENPYKPSAISALLRGGARVKNTENCGCSSLYLAAREGHYGIVARLLERNAATDLCAEGGFSPNFAAASNGFEDIVALLLGRGANAAIPDDLRHTPLYQVTLTLIW